MDGKLKEIADNYYAVTSVNDFDNSRDCEVLKHKYFMLGCELIYNEMRESQNSSTSDEALPIGDVVEQSEQLTPNGSYYTECECGNLVHAREKNCKKCGL